MRGEGRGEKERKEANIFEGLSLVNLFPSSDEKIYSEI